MLGAEGRGGGGGGGAEGRGGGRILGMRRVLNYLKLRVLEFLGSEFRVRGRRVSGDGLGIQALRGF